MEIVEKRVIEGAALVLEELGGLRVHSGIPTLEEAAWFNAREASSGLEKRCILLLLLFRQAWGHWGSLEKCNKSDFMLDAARVLR